MVINLSALIIPPQLLRIIKSSTPLTCRHTVTDQLQYKCNASEIKALQQLFPPIFFFLPNVKLKIFEENRFFHLNTFRESKQYNFVRGFV